MQTLFILLLGLLGLAIGSFLNVVILRLETGESFVRGRSHCPRCKHILSWYDLIPVFSFLWLQGKCRYCKAKISWQYPLIEISTALVFLLIFNYQFSITNQSPNYQIINLVVLLYIASSLIVIFVYDLKYYLIPDVVLFPATVITFVYRVFEFLNLHHWDLGFGISSLLLSYILAAMMASGFFLAIFLISQGRWMGFGDVKLAVLLGLLLGFPNILLALFLAFALGAIIGVGGMLLKKTGLKSEIPFAPFLILGTGIALFWGGQIMNWYMGFFII